MICFFGFAVFESLVRKVEIILFREIKSYDLRHYFFFFFFGFW